MPVWLTAGAVIALLAMMALVFVLILVYALKRPSGGDSARYTIAAAVVALAVLVAVALFVLHMALADARAKPREKEKEGDRIRSIGTAGVATGLARLDEPRRYSRGRRGGRCPKRSKRGGGNDRRFLMMPGVLTCLCRRPQLVSLVRESPVKVHGDARKTIRILGVNSGGNRERVLREPGRFAENARFFTRDVIDPWRQESKDERK
jgi:hypothetical protein